MEAQELRTKTADQLLDLLKQLRKEAFNLRFQAASGELKNTVRARQVRRDAARILTVINEKKKA
ncbi:50S ribosomal protein L29 [bacterium]|nr:50S ribosomal protein L29 [bacterium]